MISVDFVCVDNFLLCPVRMCLRNQIFQLLLLLVTIKLIGTEYLDPTQRQVYLENN